MAVAFYNEENIKQKGYVPGAKIYGIYNPRLVFTIDGNYEQEEEGMWTVSVINEKGRRQKVILYDNDLEKWATLITNLNTTPEGVERELGYKPGAIIRDRYGSQEIFTIGPDHHPYRYGTSYMIKAFNNRGGEHIIVLYNASRDHTWAPIIYDSPNTVEPEIKIQLPGERAYWFSEGYYAMFEDEDGRELVKIGTIAAGEPSLRPIKVYKGYSHTLMGWVNPHDLFPQEFTIGQRVVNPQTGKYYTVENVIYPTNHYISVKTIEGYVLEMDRHTLRPCTSAEVEAHFTNKKLTIDDLVEGEGRAQQRKEMVIETDTIVNFLNQKTDGRIIKVRRPAPEIRGAEAIRGRAIPGKSRTSTVRSGPQLYPTSPFEQAEGIDYP